MPRGQGGTPCAFVPLQDGAQSLSRLEAAVARAASSGHESAKADSHVAGFATSNDASTGLVAFAVLARWVVHFSHYIGFVLSQAIGVSPKILGCFLVLGCGTARLRIMPLGSGPKLSQNLVAILRPHGVILLWGSVRLDWNGQSTDMACGYIREKTVATVELRSLRKLIQSMRRAPFANVASL
ncbi:hypothetical protein BS17DRAFT_821212 [Gyrodon lividus]|nr:hypothetical protein BS17DRAFT_821212 [Gyrodon lividus]